MGNLLETKLDTIILNLQLLYDLNKTNFDLFWSAYYPLKSSTPLYWKYWNSDTKKYEDTNIANVLSQMTWYLGNIYLDADNYLKSISADVSNIADDVSNIAKNIVGTEDSELNNKVTEVKDKVSEFDKSEQQIVDSASDAFSKFDPSSNDYFGSLKALSWCGNYLQQIYEKLGLYGIPITIALLLGVCMQFIGYFRYKK